VIRLFGHWERQTIGGRAQQSLFTDGAILANGVQNSINLGATSEQLSPYLNRPTLLGQQDPEAAAVTDRLILHLLKIAAGGSGPLFASVPLAFRRAGGVIRVRPARRCSRLRSRHSVPAVGLGDFALALQTCDPMPGESMLQCDVRRLPGVSRMNRWPDWWKQCLRDLRHAEHALDDGDHEWAAFAAQHSAEKA
jgi:hypothetical protein